MVTADLVEIGEKLELQKYLYNDICFKTGNWDITITDINYCRGYNEFKKLHINTMLERYIIICPNTAI